MTARNMFLKVPLEDTTGMNASERNSQNSCNSTLISTDEAQAIQGNKQNLSNSPSET